MPILESQTKFENSLSCAQHLDRNDPLKKYREQFYIPQYKGKEAIYFCGNSLGAQPKSTQHYIEQERQDWQELGVKGHFNSQNPWYYYQNFLKDSLAKIIGAKPSEVVAMNTLTVNLHLMMVSFYQPTSKRYKIIIEGSAFPSDKYAVASQATHHGFDPHDAIVELHPREGEHYLRTQDIIQKVEETGDELALVLLGAVQYYTGQYFDLQAITEAAHQVGAMAGYDCAHATGNVPMKLHDWKVDFAAWCGYKYLNSGPGGVAGAFIHQKHGSNLSLKRFTGWWGTNEETRFDMAPQFVPQSGAGGWQMSNAPVFAMAMQRASLAIFEAAGMENLRKKSILLTGYLEFLLNDINENFEADIFTLITPNDPKQRGCQLSILTPANIGPAIFEYLTQSNVIADWRKPNVIRVAPVPLYNTFEEVYRFAKLLKEGCERVV